MVNHILECKKNSKANYCNRLSRSKGQRSLGRYPHKIILTLFDDAYGNRNCYYLD